MAEKKSKEIRSPEERWDDMVKTGKVKQTEIKDKKGNPVLDEKGKPKTELRLAGWLNREKYLVKARENDRQNAEYAKAGGKTAYFKAKGYATSSKYLSYQALVKEAKARKVRKFSPEDKSNFIKAFDAFVDSFLDKIRTVGRSERKAAFDQIFTIKSVRQAKSAERTIAKLIVKEEREKAKLAKIADQIKKARVSGA